MSRCGCGSGQSLSLGLVFGMTWVAPTTGLHPKLQNMAVGLCALYLCSQIFLDLCSIFCLPASLSISVSRCQSFSSNFSASLFHSWALSLRYEVWGHMCCCGVWGSIPGVLRGFWEKTARGIGGEPVRVWVRSWEFGIGVCVWEGQSWGSEVKDQQGLGWKRRQALRSGKSCLVSWLRAEVWTMAVGAWGRAGDQAGAEPHVPTVGWLRPGTYQEEAPGGPVLCADIADCGYTQEDAAHWPEHVCTH